MAFYVFWYIWLFRVLWLWSNYRWTTKQQGEHEIYLVQQIGREVFGVSLYEVKDGHCRTEGIRSYTQSRVHTVTEIPVLSSHSYLHRLCLKGTGRLLGKPWFDSLD